METYGIEKLGIINPSAVYRNQSLAQLTEHALRRGEGLLSKTGALVVKTGKYTGRSANDTKSGMEEQMKSLANLGLLGNFIGMLTDSRSFLSYTRHDYFRRILCNLVGNWVENGEYPNIESALKQIIEGVSYNNAARYFGLQ